MTHFIHSNLNKSKPGRKLIRFPQQCDISAPMVQPSETIYLLHESDEKKKLGHIKQEL
jgi:hypothetical protein